MDPQATWDRMLTANAESDLASAKEYAQTLKNWLRSGGFPPIVLGHSDIGPDFEKVLALAGCTFVLGFDVTEEAVSRIPTTKRSTP